MTKTSIPIVSGVGVPMHEAPMTRQAVTSQRPTLLGLSIPTLSYFVLYLVALDSWMTHCSLSAGRGVELNPFMDWLYQHGGVLVFLGLKLMLTGFCLIWINRRAPDAAARVAVLVALSIYLPVTGIHIMGLYS